MEGKKQIFSYYIAQILQIKFIFSFDASCVYLQVYHIYMYFSKNKNNKAMLSGLGGTNVINWTTLKNSFGNVF